MPTYLSTNLNDCRAKITDLQKSKNWSEKEINDYNRLKSEEAMYLDGRRPVDGISYPVEAVSTMKHQPADDSRRKVARSAYARAQKQGNVRPH